MIRKIVVRAAAVLAALALAVVAIGYALPRGHVASRESTFTSPPATVFEAIADVARYPEWRDGVARIEVLSAAPLKWREHAGGDVLTFEVVESRPPDVLRVRIADPDLPFGGTWTYEVLSEGSGTRLRITENGEVYNPVFRFMSRFVFGHRASIDGFIAALHRRVP